MAKDKSKKSAELLVEASRLRQLLQEFGSLVGKGPVAISAKNGVIRMEADNKATVAMVRVMEAEGQGSLAFVVDNLTLTGIIVNRGKISLTVDDNQLTVKSVGTRYRAEIGVEKHEPQMVLPEGLEVVPLEKSHRTLLTEVLPKVSMNPIFSPNETMIAQVRVTPDITQVTCLSNYHGAIYIGPGSKKTLRIDIPAVLANSMIGKFMAMAPSGGFGIDGSHLYLISDQVQLRLGYIAVDEPNQGAVDYVKSNPSVMTIKINRDELDTMLDNMMGVFVEGSVLAATITQDSFSLESRTENGSVSDTLSLVEPIKLKKPKTAHLSLLILQEILGKTSDKQITLEFHTSGVEGEVDLHNMIIKSPLHKGTLNLIGTLMGAQG